MKPQNPASSPITPITPENYFDLLSLLSEVVVSTSDLASILQSTVRLIQRMVSVQRCSILVLDKGGEYLDVGAAAGIPDDVVPNIRVRVGEGIAGKVVQSGEPVFRDDPTPTPVTKEPESDRYSTRSFICVPIRHQENTFGVINVTNKFNRARLDPNDLALLQSVARFLGLAMERYRLYVETELLHAHLGRTVENLPVGLLTVRADGTLLTINPSAARLLDLREPGEGERVLSDCFSPSTARCLSSLLDATLAGRPPQVKEADIRTEGSIDFTPVRLTAQPVEVAGNQKAEVLILVEDLSLRREVAELRRLDELKSNFIAMISHELRTPLTSIRGAAHLLDTCYAATLDDTQRNLVRIVGTNTERLISLVNNILDISLLDSQAIHIEFGRADLKKVIRDCVAKIHASAKEKRIDIRVAVDDTPLLVWGDPDRLDQILNQILGNAVKFTPAGGSIAIHAGSENRTAILDVIDSGEGIPMALREKVFEKFFQGESTLTRRAGGTGIGLYLARALTEIHGGTIAAVESQGMGAHIQIRIPLESSPQSPKNRSGLTS